MKRLLLLLFLVVVLVGVVLSGLAGSERGTRLIFSLVQDVHPPLKVESITGTLMGALTLNGLSYQTDTFRLSADTLRLVWRPSALRRRSVVIERLELDHPRFELLPTEQVAEPVVLPEISIPLPIEIKNLVVRQLEVIQPQEEGLVIDRVSLSASLGRERLDLLHLDVIMAEMEAKGSGAVTFRHQWPIDATLDWRYRDDVLWNGAAKISGNLQTLTLDHRLMSPFSATATGKLTRLFDGPRFDMKGSWQEIGWPLKGAREWFGRNGRFHVHGRFDQYRFEVATEVSGSQLPATRVQLKGKGDDQGFFMAPLIAEGPAGYLEAVGDFHWAPKPVWDVVLKGHDIDTGQFQPDWPGQFALEARSLGVLEPVLRIQLELKHLSGELRGQPLEATGNIQYRGDTIRADHMALEWGGNQIQLNGQGSRQKLDLEFELQAPHLERLDPELEGNLSGQGKVTGSPGKPRIELLIQGEKISWGEVVQVQHVSLNVKGAADDPESQLLLELHHLNINQWQFNQAALTGRGQLANHRISLNAKGPQGKALIHVEGGYTNERGQWQGEIQHLPLALLKKLLPEHVTATGDLYASFSYHQEAQTREGELEWGFKGATLSTSAADGQKLSLSLDQSEGRLILQGQALRLFFDFPIADYGQLRGEVDTSLETQVLKGEGEFAFNRLELIEVFVSDLQQIDGSANGEFQLGGTWDHPKIQARMAVVDASAKVPAAGISLENIQLMANSRPDGYIEFNGQARSGPGDIEIRGRILMVSELAVTATLKGSQFLVADLPEARVLLSPQLELNATRELVEVNGKVHVPEAKIDLKTSLFPSQEPDMVSVSPDEVIIGRPVEPKKRAMNISTNVLVTLGDKVYFNGYGVESQLQGELRLSSWKGVPKAEGVIEVVKGKFAAYGQKLDIDSGRIIFNGPVDNPGLDIEVARRFRREQITITLNIGGSAREPVIKISSDPSMPEEEALSYLITGRSLQNRSSMTSTGSMEKQLTNALGSLGLGYLKKLGLSEYAEVEFEEGFVMLGRYLTPDLYVGYAVDVFDGLGEAVVRYRLTEYLTLEGRYGESQSGDIFYTIETD